MAREEVVQLMTTPTFQATPAPPGEPLFTDPMPDHSANGKDKPVSPPVPPTPGKKTAQPKLGNNRPARTARKLTDADKEKIAGYYGSIAMGVGLFRPKVAKTIVQNAESCAQAWFDLAQENDSVRRTLLAMMEGSAWAGILTAHLPIVVMALPENIVERNPILGPIQAMVENDGNEQNSSVD